MSSARRKLRTQRKNRPLLRAGLRVFWGADRAEGWRSSPGGPFLTVEISQRMWQQGCRGVGAVKPGVGELSEPRVESKGWLSHAAAFVSSATATLGLPEGGGEGR